MRRRQLDSPLRPKRGLAGLALLLIANILDAAEPTSRTLPPKTMHNLATPTLGIAWLDASTVLLAADGVVAYRIKDSQTSTVVAKSAVPAGLPSVDGVATDGRTVAAFTVMDNSQFVARVSDRKRILARTSGRFYVMGMAVAGDRLYVLGMPIDRSGVANPDGVAVWVGALDANWSDFKPLHKIKSPAATRVFNDATFPHAGSIATDNEGNVYVTTSAEPGIYRYDAAGKLTATYGAALSDLVIGRMHDLNYRYATDPEGRYRDLLNLQKTIDQLVITPDGPALVVRTVHANRVQWALEYPGPQGVHARYTLGVERAGPYGHIRCSAFQRQLGCVFSKPNGPTKTYHLATWALPDLGTARR